MNMNDDWCLQSIDFEVKIIQKNLIFSFLNLRRASDKPRGTTWTTLGRITQVVRLLPSGSFGYISNMNLEYNSFIITWFFFFF